MEKELFKYFWKVPPKPCLLPASVSLFGVLSSVCMLMRQVRRRRYVNQLRASSSSSSSSSSSPYWRSADAPKVDGSMGRPQLRTPRFFQHTPFQPFQPGYRDCCRCHEGGSSRENAMFGQNKYYTVGAPNQSFMDRALHAGRKGDRIANEV